ncbi:MAG: ParB/RepB/Spo0J family partition protein [Acidobacteriota bacterium]
MSAKRKGLGRGLDALLGGGSELASTSEATPSSPSSKTTTPRELDVHQLAPNRFQPRTRFVETDLEELSASIREQGVVQPIVVAPKQEGGFSIIAGERRWRASQLAGLKRVPVVVREVSGDQELLELALVENVQRTDLNAVEEAEAYKMLQESFGLSQEKIAHRVGKARTTVTNAMRLLRLAPEVLDLLREGALSAGQARPLLALPAKQDQVDLARRAIEQNLSARDLERIVSATTKPKKAPKEPDPLEVHAAAAAEKLTRRLNSRVLIKRKGAGGMVTIRFAAEEDLIRIYDLLMARGESDS